MYNIYREKQKVPLNLLHISKLKRVRGSVVVVINVILKNYCGEKSYDEQSKASNVSVA